MENCFKNGVYSYVPSFYTQGIATFFKNSYLHYELNNIYDSEFNINETVIMFNFVYARDIT
jgi:hypothetical protein